MPIDMERWLRPSEAARRLGITSIRVAQLRREGRLEALPTPLGNLIDAESVERFRAEREARLVRSKPTEAPSPAGKPGRASTLYDGGGEM